MSADAEDQAKADSLRKRAEEAAASDAAAVQSALSLKSAQDTLHELRVYQIELRMQNEELRRSQLELASSWARYFDLYDKAPVGYVTLNDDGLILEANRTAAELLGVGGDALRKQPLTRFILAADQDIYYLHRKQLAGPDRPRACELRLLRVDAEPFWARLEATALEAPAADAAQTRLAASGQDPDEAPAVRLVVSDITAQKSQEDEREVVVRLLKLLNSDNDLRGLMQEVTLLLRSWSNCHAVGIRLREGDDFPYFETRSFPPEFVRAECALCRYDSSGQPERDASGNPILECMCGNVLRGRFDPDQPFFTASGSFWTNSTTETLARSTEAERQALTRNRCNAAGYESVALIPLRERGTALGLLQVNDKRRGRFTPERIALLERLADNLAIAIAHRRAKTALLEGEQFLKSTTDSLSTHICVLSQTGQILWVNQAWEDFAAANLAMSGTVGEGAEYLAVCDSATGPDAEIARAFAAGIRAVMAGECPAFEMEYPCHSPQVRRWFVGRVTPFADATTHRVVIAHENITARKLAERQQHLSAEILSVLNEPLALRGAIDRILEAIKRETGFDAVGIRLRRGDDFPYFIHSGFSDGFVAQENSLAVYAPGGDVCRDKDGVVALECTCGLVLSGRTDPDNPMFTPGGSFWTNDARCLLEIPADRDSRIRPRNRCVQDGFRSVALIPVHGGGEIVGLLQFSDRRNDCLTLDMIHFFESVSDSIGIALTRMQTEEKVRESERRHRTILRTAMDGFWRVDIQGRLLEVNDAYCRMSGYSEQELLAMRIPDLEASEAPDGTAAHIQEIMAQREDRFDSAHRRKDGTCFEVEVSAQYKPERGGHLVAFIKDITERRQTERELSERRRQLYHMERVQTMGQIASSLAHEINQPLAGILSNAQAAQRFLEETEPDMSQIREILTDIEEDDRRAGEVVTRIRAMLRKDAPSHTSLDVNDSVREAMALVQADLVQHGVTARAELAGGLPRVRADKTQIDQVLVNLIMNAEQALQREAECRKEIVVSAMRDTPGHVTVSVRDTGPGIAPEAMPRLFDPFYTTKADGLGMGLAICRSIVTSHSGRIWAENHPDGGAVVCFSLPAEE